MGEAARQQAILNRTQQILNRTQHLMGLQGVNASPLQQEANTAYFLQQQAFVTSHTPVPKTFDDQVEFLRGMLEDAQRDRDENGSCLAKAQARITALEAELSILRGRTEERDAAIHHAIRRGKYV
jgi:hypothetical protein